MTTPPHIPQTTLASLTTLDRRRYLVEGPLYPWPTEAKAYTHWVALRCKSQRTLRALMTYLHTSSLFLAPKKTHGTTLFMPADAWTGFGHALIEEKPIMSDIEVVAVCHKGHLNPTFLGRFGRPGHSRQHAWYQVRLSVPSGTPHNAYSNTFLIRSIVEEEMRKAHADFMRTEARMRNG